MSYTLLLSSLFIWRSSLVICFKEGLIIHSWHYIAMYIFLACTEHPISLGMLLSPGFSVVRSAINLIWTPGSLVLLSSLFLHRISQAMHIQSPKVSSGFSLLSFFLLHHFPDIFTRSYLDFFLKSQLLTTLTIIQKFTKNVGNIHRFENSGRLYTIIKAGKGPFPWKEKCQKAECSGGRSGINLLREE